MAGYIASLRDSLQTLTGLPLRGSAQSPARPLGLVPTPSVASTPSVEGSGFVASNEGEKEEVKPAAEVPASLENVMGSTVTPVSSAVSTAAKKPGFIRFIDKVGRFFVHAEPLIEEVAQEAEPILALTPFGPEYDLVVNAIVGARKTASASQAAGVALTGDQQMAMVLTAVSPALTQILASKGVKESVAEAIAQFAQNVYDLHTGPIALVEAAAKGTPAKA